MRIAFVAAAGICLLAPGQAYAVPPLADHAASSKAQAASLVDEARAKRAIGKQAYIRKGPKYKQTYVRKGPKYKRRYDWTYYPYWRPYQYRYWQYIYPYGGPLF